MLDRRSSWLAPRKIVQWGTMIVIRIKEFASYICNSLTFLIYVSSVRIQSVHEVTENGISVTKPLAVQAYG